MRPFHRRAQHRLTPLLALLAAVPWVAAAQAAPAFDEVSVAEGLVFWRAGDRADLDPNFVEIMGGGACWLDADSDGDQDLFLVNGWYNDTALAMARQPRSALYRNDGPREGADFVDATDAAGLDVRGWTQGCSAADYDADGHQDLLVIGYGIQSLFRNQGDGTFANVSAQAGITAQGKCPDNPCWGSSAAWADYDRDGCLDLYVINFVSFDLVAAGPRGPGGYDGQPAQLYRNRCDGTFDDVTATAGAHGDPGPDHSKNWGLTWLDYDLDGWLDIYVASDGVLNILYRNNRDGTFTDVADDAGVDDPRNGMGVAAGDCDDDGDEDLFFTHYEFSGVPGLEWWGYDGFFVNEGDGTFSDHSGEGDLAVTLPYVKWGVGWEDFDNDADLDLHVATGHTENGAPDAEQPHLFWLGDGACGFADARAAGGATLREERNGRGSSYADWDLDGALDAAVVNIMDQDVELLRGAPGQGHWLRLELRQPGGNARAIGAELEVELPGGRVQHRRLMPFQSIHGSNADAVHVGLGGAETANVTVTWPQDRALERFEGLPADKVLRLHRGGRVQADTLAPESRLVAEGPEGEPGWWRGPVQVRVEAADRGVGGAAGVAAVELEVDGAPAPGASALLGEGAHRVRHRAHDAEGNAEPWRSLAAGVDSEAPVSAALMDGALVDGWYRGPVRVALGCADATSGVGRLEWRLDAGAWTTYDDPFDLTRPGQHTFAWRCVDAAGNEEPAQSFSVALDLGHPETLARVAGTPGLEGWWRSDVVVELEPAGGLHAIAATDVGVDGAPFAPYEGPFVLGEGDHLLRFRSTDTAGRAEPLREVAVRVDATPPVLDARDAGPHLRAGDGLVIGPRNAVAPAAEDEGSGIAWVEARQDLRAWRPPGAALVYRVEGPHQLAVRAADRAGNAASRAVPLALDLTPPALGVLRPYDRTIHLADLAAEPMPPVDGLGRAVLVGPVTLEAAAEDAHGVREVRFTVDDARVAADGAAPWTWTWSLPPGRLVRNVTFEAEDAVGNPAEVAFDVVVTGDPFAIVPAAPLQVPTDAALGIGLLGIGAALLQFRRRRWM